MLRLMAAASMALMLAAAPAAHAAPSTDPAKMPAGTYVLEKTHATIVGKVWHFGLSHYTMRFNTFDATYDYDPKAPEAAKVKVTIDANSLDVGNAKVNAEFAKKFLGSDKNPTITFVSTAIKREASTNKGTMAGDLTLNGVTKPVTLDVTFNGFGDVMGAGKAGFSATGVVKRSEFNSSDYIPAVGDEIDLEIQVEFTRK